MAARTARLDVRLTAAKAARLREVAASLGCSQADVVRLALQSAERCPCSRQPIWTCRPCSRGS